MLIILFWDKLSRLPMFQRTLKAISVQKTRLKLLYHCTILPQKSLRDSRKQLASSTLEEMRKKCFWTMGMTRKSPKFSVQLRYFLCQICSQGLSLINTRTRCCMKRGWLFLLFFLPSTTYKKDEINQHISNVRFHAIDRPHDDFQKLSPSGRVFVPSELELRGEERNVTRETVVEFLKRTAEFSNPNLIRNANDFLSKMEVELSVEWMEKEKNWMDSSKYLFYY